MDNNHTDWKQRAAFLCNTRSWHSWWTVRGERDIIFDSRSIQISWSWHIISWSLIAAIVTTIWKQSYLSEYYRHLHFLSLIWWLLYVLSISTYVSVFVGHQNKKLTYLKCYQFWLQYKCQFCGGGGNMAYCVKWEINKFLSFYLKATTWS